MGRLHDASSVKELSVHGSIDFCKQWCAQQQDEIWASPMAPTAVSLLGRWWGTLQSCPERRQTTKSKLCQGQCRQGIN